MCSGRVEGALPVRGGLSLDWGGLWGGIRLDTASRGSHARQQARREKAIYTPHAGKTEEAPQEGDAVEARRQRVDDGVDLTV